MYKKTKSSIIKGPFGIARSPSKCSNFWLNIDCLWEKDSQRNGVHVQELKGNFDVCCAEHLNTLIGYLKQNHFTTDDLQNLSGHVSLVRSSDYYRKDPKIIFKFEQIDFAIQQCVQNNGYPSQMADWSGSARSAYGWPKF